MLIKLLDTAKAVTLMGQRLSAQTRLSFEVNKSALINTERLSGRSDTSDIADIELFLKSGVIRVEDEGHIITTVAEFRQLMTEGFIQSPGSVTVRHEGAIISHATDLNFKGTLTVVPTSPTSVDITVVGGGGGSTAHLIRSFDFNDVAAGEAVIGTVLAGSVVQSVVLSIESAFTTGLQMTIGSDAAHAEIMTVIDNMPDYPAKYSVNSDILYVADTVLKVFFPVGASVQGTAKATVFIS